MRIANFFIVIMLLLGSCSDKPPFFKIKEGMDQERVEQILGEPEIMQQIWRDGFDLWVWNSGQLIGTAVLFYNGEVIAKERGDPEHITRVFFGPWVDLAAIKLGEDPGNFRFGLIYEGMTKNDVESILGPTKLDSDINVRHSFAAYQDSTIAKAIMVIYTNDKVTKVIDVREKISDSSDALINEAVEALTGYYQIRFDKLFKGASEREVIELLGEPDDKSLRFAGRDIDLMGWSIPGKGIVVIFSDGILNHKMIGSNEEIKKQMGEWLKSYR